MTMPRCAPALVFAVSAALIHAARQPHGSFLTSTRHGPLSHAPATVGSPSSSASNASMKLSPRAGPARSSPVTTRVTG